MPSFHLNQILVIIYNILIYTQLLINVSESGEQCNDTRTTYTDCDADNKLRWIIVVPREKESCLNKELPQPKSILCDTNCLSGTYMDINKKNCTECPSGTFSIGGGVRYTFDQNLTLPSAFTINSYSFKDSTISETPFTADDDDDEENNDCESAKWTITGNVIRSDLRRNCVVQLMLKITLIHRGYIEFLYNNVGESLAFLKIDSQCGDKKQKKSMPKYVFKSTGQGVWKSKRIQLEKEGQYQFSFYVLDIMDNHFPVSIKSIEVQGVSSLPECQPCPAGTYSNKIGVSNCSVCLRNTYSTRGSTECTPCNENQFSVEGSSQCTTKRECKQSDYQYVYSECDASNMITKSYVPIEPKICGRDVVNLPSTKVPCIACNPGMYRLPNGTCSFCPNNTYSDGTMKQCQACNSNLSLTTGLYYNQWHVMPPYLDRLCFELEGTEGTTCFGNQSWTLEMDYLTSIVNNNIYSVLELPIENGFKDTSMSNDYGTLYFKFSMKCLLPCELFLATSDANRQRLDIIKKWSSKKDTSDHNNIIEYRYTVHESIPVLFTWIFGRKSPYSEISIDTSSIEIRIYEIHVRNTIDGGADSCVTCQIIDDKHPGCRVCQPGFIISNGTCLRCENNTIVSQNRTSDKKNDNQQQYCAKCPRNTVSYDGVTCIIDCKQTFETQFNYDLTRISSVEFQSSKVFSQEGFPYSHIFNASICGSGIIRCVVNDTLEVKRNRLAVESRLCRTLIAPEDNVTMARSVDDFGEELVNVSLWSDLKSFPHLKTDYNISDVTLVFRASSLRSACNERITFLSLRCDDQIENATRYKVQYPIDSSLNCVSGTCDGCTFRFLLRTIDACPICEESTGYEIFRGECHMGKQQIRKIPNSYCIRRLREHSEIQKCSLLTIEIEIVILISFITAIILCILLVYCWKKNKTLQYRYMQLIENVNPDDDAPVDNVCGTGLDDEDDDEEIDMKKQSKAKKFMNVVKKALKKDNNQPRENFLLTSEA